MKQEELLKVLNDFDDINQPVYELNNLVKLLKLEQLNAKSSNREYALIHIAARQGCIQTVQYLLDKGINIDIATNCGETPLHIAAEYGNFNMVKYLIENRAVVNAKDWNGETPLHWACKSCNIKVVKYLIDKGADVNAADDSDYIPLHEAARNGNLEVVAHLISKGSIVNPDNAPDTPLFRAMEEGNAEIVNHLIEKGVDVNEYNYLLGLPLTYSIRLGNKNLVNIISPKTSENIKIEVFESFRDKLDSLKKKNSFDVLDIVYEHFEINKDIYTELYSEIYNKYNVNVSQLLKELKEDDVSYEDITKLIKDFIGTIKLNTDKNSLRINMFSFISSIITAREFAFIFAGDVPKDNIITNLPREIQSHILSYLNVDGGETLSYLDKVKRNRAGYNKEL
ncbi:MAG: ankyrin repeat domain-containing protein [Alphaproteobacteria bacterium]|nr:ankyrin repeat domain-containing protein [Alphaproteobacteria bacterium]OJV16108.1 MAG: hypothetical protein BGO27_02605 [Alphaproteobacteria bacterium 33-17]